MSYIQEAYFQNIEYPSWFEPRLLIDNPNASRFSSDTSLSTIVKEMMIEEWNSFYSYNHFYDLCAPDYCTYSERIHSKSTTGIIITLISTTGGLITLLRLLTPLLVKLIFGFQKILTKGRRQQEQQQSGKC